jgi:hypothetical protein
MKKEIVRPFRLTSTVFGGEFRSCTNASSLVAGKHFIVPPFGAENIVYTVTLKQQIRALSTAESMLGLGEGIQSLSAALDQRFPNSGLGDRLVRLASLAPTEDEAPLSLQSAWRAVQFVSAQHHLPVPELVIAPDGNIQFIWSLPSCDTELHAKFLPSDSVTFLLTAPDNPQMGTVTTAVFATILHSIDDAWYSRAHNSRARITLLGTRHHGRSIGPDTSPTRRFSLEPPITDSSR